MCWLKRKKTVVVHDGNFHADDVFAVAILAIYLDYIPKVIRTRNPYNFKKADYIFDVGLEYNPQENKFDHHQEGWSLKRDNGILYASCGLVWRELGEKICLSKEIVNLIDKKIIQTIDAEDNGIEIYKNIIADVKVYSVFDFIYSFNPTWQEKRTRNKAFLEAVKITLNLLKREIIKAQHFLEGEKKIIEIYNKTADKRILVLDQDYEYRRIVENFPETLLVIRPISQNGNWHINTVRTKENMFQSRMDFPLAWSGKEGAEFQEITGVKEAIFCHNKRFVVACQTRESSVVLAQLAISLLKP
jgi:uncharacterized UPF0160 family protein